MRKKEGVQFWSIFGTLLDPFMLLHFSLYSTHAFMKSKAVVVYLTDPAASKQSSFHLELNHEVTLNVAQIVSNILFLMVER